METDWREILKLSQNELKQAEKEKLCDSLSWMEADDIELNFADLKTLFRLAQDIIKYKTEQVNGVLGKLEKTKRKIKTKERSTLTDSPAASSDSVFETITHQEEVIKANKDILEQLYADIAELEKRKVQHDGETNTNQESESSRGTLSELNAVAQLENEVSKRNRHIRKLLGDVKNLEEEKNMFKEKLSIFKDKLKEATLLIENLTEQLFTFNSEQTNLKELLARMEEEKANLVIETEELRNEVKKKNLITEKAEEDLKYKHQHLKDLLKRHKIKIDELSTENSQLKEEITQRPKFVESHKKTKFEDSKVKELQDKLIEASEEMIKSANLIQILREENNRLKVVIEDIPDKSVSDHKNESDDGKERNMINKLKRKVKSLNVALQGTEELVSLKEKELTEITAQLKLLRSEEGVNALIEGIKNKKRHLKIKDEGIKSLIQEVNLLNSLVSELQLENAVMRKNLNIPDNEKLNTYGILKKYKDLEIANAELTKHLQENEDKLISLEIDNYNKKSVLQQLKSAVKSTDLRASNETNDEYITSDTLKTIMEENEGLRNGLTEILTYIKDNSKTTSGILSMECPSLEAILNSMEARKLAGWFSPHMKTVMELKAAIGSKDALMSALHDSRKETFKVMKKLTEEEQKTSDLEKVILDIKEKTVTKTETEDKISSIADTIGEFGSWMTNAEYEKLDFADGNQIQKVLTKGNILFENQFVHALQYFQNKFTMLFDKLTSLTITAEDDFNKWLVKEEQYKAEIENLKYQIDEHEDDTSNRSPGLLTTSKLNYMDRKYNFLEESFKQIRTLNENLRNEYLESKKERMSESFEYEKKVQHLIISVLNLSDKLRNSIPIELFLEQNEVLNQYIIKYRNIIEVNNTKHIRTLDIIKRLDDDKLDIMNRFHKIIQDSTIIKFEQTSNILSSVEQLVLQKQLEQLSLELNKKNEETELLEKKILDLEISQSLLIDKVMRIEDSEEINIIKDQIKSLQEENKILKDQQKDTKNKNDVLHLQLKADENQKINYDTEINMLRHQILDLQSLGDNKAIISRLSGEVLLAQVQASESYEKIESLKLRLCREKQIRAEAEEMLNKRQKVFDIYSKRCIKQFRSMNDIVEVLRNQYTGCLPLISAESYFYRLEEMQLKSQETNEKLSNLEQLQSNLMTKHSIYSQILDLSNTKCFEDEDSCPHKLQNIVMEKTQKLDLENHNNKIALFEQSHKKLLDRCNSLERTLVLVNKGFKISNTKYEKSFGRKENGRIEVQDIQSSEEINSKGSLTYTLPNLKQHDLHLEDGITRCDHFDNKIVNKTFLQFKKLEHRETQTHSYKLTDVKLIQTDKDEKTVELTSQIDQLLSENRQKEKLLKEFNILFHRQSQDLLLVNTEKNELNNKLQSLFQTIDEKDTKINKLEIVVDSSKKEIYDIKLKEQKRANETENAENQALVVNLKKIESDKNAVIMEYKELLRKERQEYLKSIKILQSKLLESQTGVDERQFKATSSNNDVAKDTTNKNTIKINELEDKCFKLQSEIAGYKTDLKNQLSELERWKELAVERLTKMEQLSAQLKERHNHEMESYKAENQHWLSQLNETQREHIELRSRLTEQKAFHVKQLAEKDAHIEHLRSVINNLKTQVLNMQTMLTVNDPSFDLSAIVEVDELSDVVSQQGSDRLELKFESTVDLNEIHEDFVRIPNTSTAIWQEPLIERLRREKQLVGKQNAILRRQIKVLAARERRSRLDAQNLKNQVFRISTTGNKVPSAESAAFQNKIASLQAQLTSARRDAHSSVALWDKWKRAQQTAERWQAKFEEKTQEMKKIEISLNLSKSAVARLEKEKRALLIRLGDMKHERSLSIEKQDAETSEKAMSRNEDYIDPPPVSTRALLDRVEAQQRRIAALELAEKGNETLVAEYEKCLAEITSLKGQVLKLESTLLEAQIRSPLQSTSDPKPELDYWKNYCDMLKEENMQLTLRVNCLENVPTSASHQRVSDLEQTVLTLRGLVSKLQSDQKSSVGVHRRVDSRPGSGRSSSEKMRTHVESYRIEISNLKKSILEKDALLENSKEMLRIAAEREDDLLRENSLLQRRLEQIDIKRGVMSI
ncbi:centrosomal protein of 290 kDa-like [Pararge aegeria]|uniref:centrosomal protein of 290 kDa-like n=1 Tax=Pararge aegeria TaxID=116150 RepID=UPI0019CFC419|nr:centrosomal protein of 290 kDa-like [Pararge aegeria]